MNPRPLVLRSVVAAPLALLSACLTSEPYVEGGVALFAPQLGGNVRLDDSAGNNNGSVTVDGGLGLSGTEYVPYGEARGGILGFNGEVSGFRSKFSGSATLPANFGNIPAGTAIHSDFDFNDAKADVTANLIDLGPVRLAAGLGVERFDTDLKVTAPSLGGREEISAMAAVPLVVAEGELHLTPVRVHATLGAISGSYGDSKGLVLDGELTARLQIVSHVELFAGYRYLDAKLGGRAGGQDFDFDLRSFGFLAGVFVRF